MRIKMRANNALEPSFARYVRFGGDLAGFSVASLLAKRTPNLTRKHSLRSWFASARSPGQFFVVRSSPANAAQRGVERSELSRFVLRLLIDNRLLSFCSV